MQKQAIIVLSGGITKKGSIPFFVKDRLDAGYKLLYKSHAPKIIVSGKWSYLYDKPPLQTEAQAMATYLTTLGISPKKILTEELSQDLISSAYYLKKNILIPKKIRNITIIGSDFQTDRVSYLFNKILGEEYTITYQFVTSRIKPEMLWYFFSYERRTLLQTKALLRTMKKGDHDFLTNLFFSSSLYKSKTSGYTKQLVADGKIKKTTIKKDHYSIQSIYKKRLQIFSEYGLELRPSRILSADFWSGRFLNFVGRDKDRVYFAQKFALKPVDRSQFKREITLSYELAKQLPFVPTIVASDISHPPYWYLYKVVSGKMSGSFSLTYSFKESFYKNYTQVLFVDHLKKLREMDFLVQEDKKFTTTTYLSKFQAFMKKNLAIKEYASNIALHNVEHFFLDNVKKLESLTYYPAHNDLHPANIIISAKDKKLYFIDFEHALLNNIAFDFCFGYLFSWDNPVYQKQLKERFLKSLDNKEKEEFALAFPLVYSYFLLWFIGFVYIWKERAGQERYKQVKKYILSELKNIVQS